MSKKYKVLGIGNAIVDAVCKVNENFLKLKKNEESSYRPVPFYPSNPSDKNAYMCNIILQSGDHGSKYLFTENKEDTFEDNTIVEFRYDLDRKKNWRWIPIRVRYDKTAANHRLRSGMSPPSPAENTRWQNEPAHWCAHPDKTWCKTHVYYLTSKRLHCLPVEIGTSVLQEWIQFQPDTVGSGLLFPFPL